MAAIKQVSPKRERLGLEKYGLNKFPNAETSYELQYSGGQWRHGLNDEDKKKVEDYYGKSFDNSDHMDFWKNFPPFFVNHRVRVLDTDNPETILMCGVLKDIRELATSLEDTLDPMSNYPFVLTNEHEEQENKATNIEMYHDALYELRNLKKNKSYLIAVARYILPRSAAVNNETSAYVKLTEFLECKLKTSLNNSKKQAVSIFNSVLAKNKEIIFTTVDFRRAFEQNIIRMGGDSHYYNVLSGTKYGKNEEECVQFLLNPKNQEELGLNNKTDKNYSIRYQLK